MGGHTGGPGMTREDSAPGRVVDRDRGRFAKLAPDARPVMPEGYAAPLDMRTLRAVAGARSRAARD